MDKPADLAEKTVKTAHPNPGFPGECTFTSEIGNVKMVKKAVVKKANSAIALYDDVRPDHVQVGKRGSESVGIEDLTIPRLSIIQDLSPQKKASKPEYIEGAEAGMLFNSVSNRLYGDTVVFVPCFFRKEYLIWGNRAEPHKFEGFFGAYGTEALAKEALAELPEGPKCEIVETAQHFGLIIDMDASTAEEPVVDEVVVPMSKSKLKISRQLNSLVQMSGMDRFARMYELTGVEAQNKKNQDFYNYAITQRGYTPAAIFAMAEKLYEAVSTGVRNANYDDASGDDTGKAEY